jgi:hypothetical protein
MTGGGMVMCPLQDCVLKCLRNNEEVLVAKESFVSVGVEVTNFVE